MAEEIKLTDPSIPELTEVGPGDRIYIVDVSDTTDGPQGTSKYIDPENLVKTTISDLTKFTVRPTINISGTAVLVSTGSWLINGVSYNQTEGASFSFSLNDEGKERFVLIIAGTDGDYNTVEGEQSATNPAAPSLALNTLLVSIILISDSSISEIPLSAIEDLISDDADNTIVLGVDGKLWSGGGGGGSVPDATESVKGKAQLATEAETITGTNDTKIVTPLKLKVIRDGLEDQIADKEDNSNKVTTFTGSETSTTKFPVVKAIIDYFTQSRLFTILGITTLSGSNTGDQDLSDLMPYAVARTGAVIAFDTLAVYNSIASPTASNITDDLTGARIGVVQKIYSNRSSAPTFPAGWVKRGSGSYINSTLNTIFAEWSGGATVEYWIVQ